MMILRGSVWNSTISVKIYILHLYGSLWDIYWIEVIHVVARLAKLVW